jgi:hypothetical protein
MSEEESLKNQDIFMVGGANSAGQAAIYFSRYAKSVTMLVRGKSIASTMSQYLIDQITNTPNINIWTGTTLKEAIGETHLESIRIYRADSQDEETLPAKALSFLWVRNHRQIGWTIRSIEMRMDLSLPVLTLHQMERRSVILLTSEILICLKPLHRVYLWLEMYVMVQLKGLLLLLVKDQWQ